MATVRRQWPQCAARMAAPAVPAGSACVGPTTQFTDDFLSRNKKNPLRPDPGGAPHALLRSTHAPLCRAQFWDGVGLVLLCHSLPLAPPSAVGPARSEGRVARRRQLPAAALPAAARWVPSGAGSGPGRPDSRVRSGPPAGGAVTRRRSDTRSVCQYRTYRRVMRGGGWTGSPRGFDA